MNSPEYYAFEEAAKRYANDNNNSDYKYVYNDIVNIP